MKKPFHFPAGKEQLHRPAEQEKAGYSLLQACLRTQLIQNREDRRPAVSRKVWRELYRPHSCCPEPLRQVQLHMRSARTETKRPEDTREPAKTGNSFELPPTLLQNDMSLFYQILREITEGEDCSQNRRERDSAKKPLPSKREQR